LAEGTTLIERRSAFEFIRDEAAKLFEMHTGSAWRPRAGSMVNHRADLADDRQPRLPASPASRGIRGDAAARSFRRRVRGQ
jgi:hypothetical protein